MQIDKIVTLANKKVFPQFSVMERSLRQSGCNLPLFVIPYDDSEKFHLPSNAYWLENDLFFEWLQKNNAHNITRKYLCLTQKKYQFVDTDLIFLTNPVDICNNLSGFVTSCGHWHSQIQTFTAQSLPFLKKKSTLWQKNCFNSGQFACEESLYDIHALIKKLSEDVFNDVCIKFIGTNHEQPGMNLLVNTSEIEINCLTLPPFNMESTWAGDYPGDFENHWKLKDRKPFIIHWAGLKINGSRPIDELFFNFFNKDEKKEWLEKEQKKPLKKTWLVKLSNVFGRLFN